MKCPVCGLDHATRPVRCMGQAMLDHLRRCGDRLDHTEECQLKLLNAYVDANPAWKGRPKA